VCNPRISIWRRHYLIFEESIDPQGHPFWRNWNKAISHRERLGAVLLSERKGVLSWRERNDAA